MTSLDEDTQPNLVTQPEEQPEANDEGDYGDELPAPGCMLWAVIGLFGLLIMLMIVILAGAAGWTEGKHEADRTFAEATRAGIDIQLTRIPAELEANNLELVGSRLYALEQVAPDNPAVQGIRATVTAMAHANATATLGAAVNPVIAAIPDDVANGNVAALQNRLAYLERVIPGAPVVAEIAATIEAVSAIVEMTPEATAEATAEAITAFETDGGFDLAELYRQAETAFAQARYEDAYDLLDAIIRIDENYEPANVEGLLRQTLRSWASSLYATTDQGKLTEAIRVTNLLEETGADLGDLDYERFAAGFYLDAARAIDLGNHTLAIQRLNELRSYQTEYKGINVNRLLFNEIVALGDAWRAESNFCQAAVEYNRALTLFNDTAARNQAEAAQQLCDTGATQTAAAPAEGIATATPEGG